MGSRGLAPLDCLPHRGREGVTLAISTPAQKLEGISTEPNLLNQLHSESQCIQTGVRMVRVGVHVSIAGSLDLAVDRAKENRVRRVSDVLAQPPGLGI